MSESGMNIQANTKLRTGVDIFAGVSNFPRVRSASGPAVKTVRMKRNQIIYRIPENASHPKPRNHINSKMESLRDERATRGAKSSVQAKTMFICQPWLMGGNHSTL